MNIELLQAGKRFNREWIFKNASLQLSAGTATAITGPNGSGKSTLLQSIGGMLQLSTGQVHYSINNKEIASEKVYPLISFCAPYADVIEEMTLLEFLRFHQHFKKPIPSLSVGDMITAIGLEGAADKQIRYYSSGMKQRVKLAQALLFDTPVVLLDEPCTNLDAAGITLYHELIKKYCTSRLVVVCSNDEVEYSFCDQRISIMQFK